MMDGKICLLPMAIFRDYTNMDFLKYMGDELRNRNVVGQELLDIVKKMPASNVINYLFKNNGNVMFSNMSSQWGINIPSNSNGAAYADLDNDGDLDLVINNINQPAFVYENKVSGQPDNNYLEVNLYGAGQNTQGIGAKIIAYNKGKQQFLEQMPTRGYQSSVSPILHFGTGQDKTIDSLRVVWGSGKQQILYKVPCNQRLALSEKNSASIYSLPKSAAPLFQEVKSPVVHTYQSNSLNDFKRQPLLINPLSFSGPCLVKGDINGDGLEDIYAGGGSGQPGAIYIQQKDGQFTKKSEPAFEEDKASEDADAVFFDADSDGFNDLYVVSGGYHNYAPDDVLLQDRLYINDGKGNFTKAGNALPQMHVSKSCVRVNDINGDGHPDLFVGGRVIPGRYPETPQSYMLINDGKARFTDQTTSDSAFFTKSWYGNRCSVGGYER
ncbi:MAG: FG-GAP-like repeat-containing protein [Segetibacter sp.]